jgi:hypothetical protein
MAAHPEWMRAGWQRNLPGGAGAMTLDRLRVPFLVVAILLNMVVVAAEVGLRGYETPLAKLVESLRGKPQSSAVDPAQTDLLSFFPGAKAGVLQGQLDKLKESGDPVRSLQTFGYGLRSLQFVDGLLLFTLLLVGMGVIVPPALQARVQGVLTLVFSLLVIFAAIALIFVALVEVILMVSILLAFPFGTIIYLIKWGHFDRSTAAGILGLFFTLKLMAGGALVLAQQRFLQNIGLVVIFIVTLVANIIVSFLHALVPGFLVSITDGIAGIVVAILGAILAVILLVQAALSTAASLKI